MRQARSVTLLLAVTVMLFALSSSASAGVNRWTSSGPAGASVIALINDPGDPRIVYAVTESGVAFRSISSGIPQWEAIDGGLSELMIASLAVDPSVSSVLYAGTPSGAMFKSMNRGDSWSEIARPSTGTIREIAIDRDRRKMYIATATGILISEDEGKIWRAIATLARDARGVKVSPNGTVYASMTQGSELYVSSNQGETWSRATVRSGAVATGKDSTVYVAESGSYQKFTTLWESRDNGFNWRAFSGPLTFVNGLVPVGSRLYAATSDGVYENETGSFIWKRVGTNTQAVTAVTLPSASRRNIYAGTRAGVIVALDGSSEWKDATGGMNAAFSSDVTLTGNGVAYAATPAGLFQSADSGANWRKVKGAEEPVTRVVTHGDQSIYISGAKGLRSSNNAGETWQMITAPTPKTPNAPPTALAVSKTSPETLYAAFRDAAILSRSTDRGRSWDSPTTGLTASYWFFYYGYSASVLETSDDDPSSAYLATDNGLYKTENSGTSWRNVLGFDYTGEIRAVASRGGMIHAAWKSGIRTSFDGGLTWSTPRLSDETVLAIAIDPMVTSRVYAGTASGRVYRSEDSGSNWALFSEGLRGAPVHRLEITESGKRIYAATSGGVYVYDLAPPLPFQRLPDDPSRLPDLIRQLPTGPRGTTAQATTNGAAAGFLLPAVGTVQGSDGTLFQTDVTLANHRATEQTVTVAFLPQGNASGPTVPTFRFNLPPASDEGGGTLTLTDIAAQMGLQGLGSMLVIATGATGEVDQAGEIDGFARVRSSARCGSGAVSQSLPAVESEHFNMQRRARALGLRHEGGYRTNLGIVNLGNLPRQFTVVVTGERRSERFSVTAPPYAPLQAAIPSGDYGAMAITVISSSGTTPWLAYGSSVDNASGDAWASVAKAVRER